LNMETIIFPFLVRVRHSKPDDLEKIVTLKKRKLCRFKRFFMHVLLYQIL
jgi:hypothetical protein